MLHLVSQSMFSGSSGKKRTDASCHHQTDTKELCGTAAHVFENRSYIWNHIYMMCLPPLPQPTLSQFGWSAKLLFVSPPSLLQAKPIYGGWLCLAPEGTDFDNPMQRSRVRACVAGLCVGSLNGYTHHVNTFTLIPPTMYGKGFSRRTSCI